jgi:hypothetical protein
MSTASTARKAQNEAIFRDANEEIESVREELSLVDGKTPFFCECDDETCREMIRLDIAEYEAVRARATTFVIARDHARAAGDVVAETEDYVVVDKKGVAGRVARETDPREREHD